MSPFEPISFGRYFLIDKIAVGGMAEVFKAKSFSHGGFEKLLVIKRILQHLTDNQDFVHMFIDEAKISVELQHPNIVQIYDFGQIAQNYFIAMECVEGKDVKGILRKLAERRKLLPMEYAVYIAHEMCKGLDYAHKRTDIQGSPLGIVHRDVSPSNILVSYSGEVKVADFGIAKAQISAFNTKGGVLKGKFEYMSPEQASGQDLDHQSDLFSAGIILHEMLTGRRLFKTESDVKTLERIKNADIQPPCTLNPGIPGRLSDIVMRALSADKAIRFEDARAFQTALLEFMSPATPDHTRENLGHFMIELFSAEIRTEREQLQVGTEAAAEIREHAPEIDLELEWEESPGSGQTMQLQPSRMPLLIALAGFLALGAIVIWATSQRPDPIVETVVMPQTQRAASLHLNISPSVESTVTLNGKVISTGADIQNTELIPDKMYELRVTAPGYLPFTDQYTVAAGERLRVPIRLTPIPAASPKTKTPVKANAAASTGAKNTDPQQPKAAAPGMLNVTVRSGWAEVSIDGIPINTAPLYQHPLTPGRHTVEIIDGPSGRRTTRVVTIVPNETTRLHF